MGEELVKERYRLEKYAKLRFGLSVEQAEDVGSYYVEEVLQGRETKSFKYFVIEYLRKYEFSSGNRQGRDLLNRQQKTSDETILDRQVGSSLLDRIDASVVYRETPHRESVAILKLYYKWGLTLDEIGDIYGYTKANVLAKLKVIYSKLNAGE